MFTPQDKLSCPQAGLKLATSSWCTSTSHAPCIILGALRTDGNSPSATREISKWNYTMNSVKTADTAKTHFNLPQSSPETRVTKTKPKSKTTRTFRASNQETGKTVAWPYTVWLTKSEYHKIATRYSGNRRKLKEKGLKMETLSSTQQPYKLGFPVGSIALLNVKLGSTTRVNKFPYKNS